MNPVRQIKKGQCGSHCPFCMSRYRIGYLAAQGFAAHGFAAQGLEAAHGLAAHGLQGLTTFFAAQGFAAHGLAAQGFAAHGLAVQVATSAVGVGRGAACAIGAAIARPAPTAIAGIRAVWEKMLDFLDMDCLTD
ncbi:hypothetical protein TH9_17475 [Thalassospira xiamenensis]|nr:hypothetical protein TH9_17475 [Thalassospira xiamenensis]